VPTQPTVATPVPPPPPPLPRRDPLVQEIKLGETIQYDIQDWDLPCAFTEESKRSIGFRTSSVPCRLFVVTAPVGTLMAEVKWDESRGFWPLLKIDELEFVPVYSPLPLPLVSSLVGRSKTTAGQSYRLSVGVVGYDFYQGHFTLTVVGG